MLGSVLLLEILRAKCTNLAAMLGSNLSGETDIFFWGLSVFLHCIQTRDYRLHHHSSQTFSHFILQAKQRRTLRT